METVLLDFNRIKILEHDDKERVFEELSFTAPDRAGEEITVDADFVEKNLGELTRSADISRYVL